MRGWEVILVPLIALVVAILASIFRGAEAARRGEGQQTGPGPRRERPRSDNSGIDLFLEEIRRRQAARQESARAGQREIRKPREEAEPLEVRPAPVAEPPPPPVRREPLRETQVVVVPVPSVPIALPAEVPLIRPIPLPPPVVVARTQSAEISALRTQIGALLKSRGGLRTAFVLREIFGEPMCHRRR